MFATLASVPAQGMPPAATAGTRGRREEEWALQRSADFERFLAGVEQRAYRIARMALRDDDDALDAVQDSMLQLARSYGNRPAEEWRPLFYRILQNRVRDFQRRRQVRNRLFGWFPTLGADDESNASPAEAAPDQRSPALQPHLQ